MKANRIIAIASLAILSVMSVSCERIQDIGEEKTSRDCDMLIYVKNEAPQTKSAAGAGVSYVSLFNEDGTENKDFILECVTVPTGADMSLADTRAALYGGGKKQGSSGWEGGDFYYYEYKAPIVLSGNCYNNKEKKGDIVYEEVTVPYDEERGLWIPEDRIWKDEEEFEFRAHLPETLNGVSNLYFSTTYLSFDYTIPASSADQQDIMFGYFPYGGASREEDGYKIADIPFKHALASIRFKAFLADGGGSGLTPNLNVEQVSLKDVFLTGSCEQNGGEDFQWTVAEDGGKVTLCGKPDNAFPLTPGSYTVLGYDEEDGNDFVFTVMPQDLEDNPVGLVLDCDSSGEHFTFNATIRSGEWKAGYTTIYRLMPNIECGTVDLGLSVIWGDRNIGALKQLEKGYSFRWGETSICENVESQYKYSDKSGNITKYNESDGLTVLQPDDDPATHFFGEPWRTPTKDECMELGNTDWIVKYGSSWTKLNSAYISVFDEPYKDRKIAHPASDGNSKVIMTSTLGSDSERYYGLHGNIGTKLSPSITLIWDDGVEVTYDYLATVSPQYYYRDNQALPVRPVIPVLKFNGLVSPDERPGNIITASADSSVSFTLAEEYKAQSWTAEADGSEFASGTGSGSVTIPSGVKKVVIKRDTGVVIGTINVN